MNWLVRWGVKKWLVGVVNTALVKYADEVEKARAFLAVAIAKMDAVTECLKSLDSKLADNRVTEEEADAAIAEAVALAEKLTSKKEISVG